VKPPTEPDQRGLAHAVAAEDGHDLAGGDAERHAVQHGAVPASGRGPPAMPLSPLVIDTQRKASPHTTMPSASVIIRK
jgi:hypothetical protein